MAEVQELMSVGSILKQAREEKGMSRPELAQEATKILPAGAQPLTKRAIESYERDDRSIPLDKAAALCSVLSLDPLSLLAEVALSGNADLTRTIQPEREESKDYAEPSYDQRVPELLNQLLSANRLIQDQLKQASSVGVVDSVAGDYSIGSSSHVDQVVGLLKELDGYRLNNAMTRRRVPVLLNLINDGLQGLEYDELYALAIERSIDMDCPRCVASRISDEDESSFWPVDAFVDFVFDASEALLEEDEEDPRAELISELEIAITDSALFGVSLGELYQESVKHLAKAVGVGSKWPFRSNESYLNKLREAALTALVQGDVTPTQVEIAVAGGES
ncbi:helix-turn-helix domain-containing protein [Magnetococcales bacterium HHB-1]